MADPKWDLATEAAKASKWPKRPNKREQKLLESVKEYADNTAPNNVIEAEGDLIVGDSEGNAEKLTLGAAGLPLVAGANAPEYAELTSDGLEDDAVITAKIDDAAVTLAKLATAVAPSHVVKFAGQATTAGSAAAEAITVTGAAETDLAFVQMVNDGTNNVTIVNAVVTTNTLTVTFSADPGNDAVINYQLLRATS